MIGPREQRERESQRKIHEYIQSNLAKGYSLESLKWALLNQGFNRMEVLAAIEAAQKQLDEERKAREKPIIKYEAVDENNETIASVSNEKGFFKKLFSRNKK